MKLLPLILITFLFSCKKENLPTVHYYETDEHFYKGEVLLPDFLHNERLIVINPLAIEEAILKSESSDDVLEGLYLNCEIIEP